MAIYTNGFEGGSVGSAVTAGNSGSGSGSTAFSSVGANIVYSDKAQDGTRSGSYQESSGSSAVRWNFETDGNYAARGYFWLSNPNSGGNLALAGLYKGDGVSYAVARVTSSSKIQFYLGRQSGKDWNPGTDFPLNEWIRVEVACEPGTSSSDGRARMALFKGNSPTVWAESGWITGVNVGGGASESLRGQFGKDLPDPPTDGLFIDSVAVKNGADYDGFVGPVREELASPVVRVTQKVNPSKIGASDGSITVAWDDVEGAEKYESDLQEGNVTSGFTADDTNAVSPKKYAGLKAGEYTVAVRAL